MTRRARVKRFAEIVEILVSKGADRQDAEHAVAESGGKGCTEGSAEGRALPRPLSRLKKYGGLFLALCILAALAVQAASTAARLGQ